MAKRVFEIAKDLSVKSKAIVEKCQAEGIPNIQNHMSSVSAGLEATVREWFSSEGAGTAVETTQKIDIEKVRVKPKTKKKARARAKSAVKKNEPETAVAVADAPSENRAASSRNEDASTMAEARIEPSGGDEAPHAEADDGGAVVEAPMKPVVEELEEAVSTAPVMNVPERPSVVKPAGPTLDQVQQPAKLFGPKVVRVDRVDPVDRPRPRRDSASSDPPVAVTARTRGGRGVGAPGPGTTDDERSSSRRNKRRGPGRGETTQRRTGRTGGEVKSWREQDLIERQARLSRSEGFLRQRRRDQKLKSQTQRERAATLVQTGGTVKVTMPLSIKDLSSATGVKAAEVVKKLFMKGIPATVNSAIDAEQAQEIMMDYEIELEVVEAKSATDIVEEQFGERETLNEQPRAPVITILGHVDHGKTSLLDRIRNSNVADREAGGITQATSAFRVPVHVGEKEREICFFDTPGHQAFSEMRARGANVTDIVVLVVAAPEGVMPQTVESISHAKAAGVPVVVALNKVDMPNATEEQIQRVLGQLAEHDLNPVAWGGETEVVHTSATTGQGIQELLETLDYQAELRDLRADFDGPARGLVIEASHVEGRGATANLLVQEGALHVGDIVVAGRAFGRVRDITSDRGQRLKSAEPSTPVTISGIDKLPDAGDRFYIVDSLRKAQEAAEHVETSERERDLAQPKVTLDTMFAQMKEAELKELRVVLKADVQGSVDVIRNSVEEISGDEVKVRVLHAAAGGITESDVTLAAASNAVVLGFNVIPSGAARRRADQQGVELRAYQVIYEIVDDVKKAAEGLLEPELRQEILGHAEVRRVFKISKVGAIAGCYVTDGTIERNALIRVTRDDIVIENDRVLEQLKRFKDDAKEVRAGQECGMKIVGYDDIKEGDILECYKQVEVRRTL